MSFDELYQTIILDHYREKHHSGLRGPYETKAYHVNPSCGGELTLRVHLDGDTIADMSYDGEGYLISQASTSVLDDFAISRDADHLPGLYDDSLEMVHSKGEIIPDEDCFEGAIVFAGVSKFPTRARYTLFTRLALRGVVAQVSAKEN